MSNEVLVRCEGVGKKFCRDFKRSLWYGLKDSLSDLIPRSGEPMDSEQVSSVEERLRPGEFWANHDVNFELRRGEAMALVGGNGAGKTTLLKMLNGLIKPDVGRIEIKGRIGALIALGAGFNPILTGRENVYVNGSVLGLSRREIDQQFDDMVGFAELEDFIDAPVQTYSSGMKVRLGFSIATSVRPDVILIDEVLAVGDSNFRSRCYGRLARVMDECAIVFVSHSAQQVTRLCQTGVLLEKGNSVEQGDIADVMLAYERRNATAGTMRVVYDADLELKHVSVETLKIEFGGELRFSMEIDSQERYEDCFLRLIVRKLDEEVVAEWNSELHKHQFDIQIGINEIDFQIPSLRFHDGQYRLSFFVMAKDRITHLVNAANVSVIETKGHCYGGIAVQL